jgi:hypothetical protein
MKSKIKEIIMSAKNETEKKADDEITTAEAEKTATIAKRRFAKAKRVSVRIPFAGKTEDEKKQEEPIVVQINGYAFTIPKGKDCDVPEQVKKLLIRKGIL